jgi:hypothetical protein
MHWPLFLIMTNKELFYFIGKCLMLDEDPGFKQEIIAKVEAGTIDWLKFSAACSEHLIIPAIYLKLKSHSIVEFLPEEFSKYLKYIYDLNLSRNTQILEQLHEITDILNQNNIYPIFLKGAGNLLDGLYSDIGERILGDIDFLVPENDFLKSAKLLENEGYEMIEPYLYFGMDSIRHYPRLSKTGLADIEIHRQLTENHQNWFHPGITNQGIKEVAAHKGCYVLSDKHKIILNFIHSQLDNEGHIYGIVSFRDLYDLYLLSQKTDIQQIIPDIKTKRKAIAYFEFAGKAFGLYEGLYAERNFSAWLFAKKLDLNLSSATFYYFYRSIVYFLHHIFIGHTTQIIKSFYSKNVRRAVIRRLGDRKWYYTYLKHNLTFWRRKKCK